MANPVLTELLIPEKYTKSCTRCDKVEAVVKKTWLKQILNNRRVPEFIRHDKLSEDEVSILFKQGEKFGNEWQKVIINVLPKGDDLVIPLPRVRSGGKPDVQLSLSQILQYVSQTNYKNLWKEAFKNYRDGFTQPEFAEESYVPYTDATALTREAIARTYGAPVVKLAEAQCYSENNFSPHANLLPASFIVESQQHFFVIHECTLEYTLLDSVTFSPSMLSSGYAKPKFIIYQLLRLMRHLHDMGLVLGDINLSDIYVGQNLWIQVIPRLLDNVSSAPDFPVDPQPRMDSPSQCDLSRLTSAWVLGALSNYDYLCALNAHAGRRFGDPKSHYVLPWVSDLASRSGAEWRDLTKSKFRLNKGDRQLDLTYDLTQSPHSLQIPHHVPDVLSEITYYVYLSRITPKQVLCKYVRSQWVPAEYPASIQRLQRWSPDECIPEFFADPSVFKSIHSDLGDLEVPSWCSSPQEFVKEHRAMLESHHVSEKLHHWIDLTFGYKLSGPAAVKAKNVCLQLVDGHKGLTGSGVVQLFSFPHPHRLPLSPFWGKIPPRLPPHKRKSAPEEEDGHSSGFDEEEPSPLSVSRLMSRSRNSLLSPPVNTPTPDADVTTICLPKDYSPVSTLNVVESLHSFSWNSYFKEVKNHYSRPGRGKVDQCKQIVASKRGKEMQVLGCLIVELFLADKLRALGITESLEKRLDSCRSVAFNRQHFLLPRCVKSLVNLLLQNDYPSVTKSGVPPPSAHQLLQPLLTAPCLVHFPETFPKLYQSLLTLLNHSRALSEIGNHDVAIAIKLSHLKVMSLASNIEQLVENEESLNLLLPFIMEMLYAPHMDVLAAWYLFEPVARALGPKLSCSLLLDAMIRLYDYETPREPQLLKKRIKIYHRSFLLRLIVRFGLFTFLESFVLPLVEAVGGYHDLVQSGHSHLGRCDVEEAVEAELLSMTLSPLDEESSADSEKPAEPIGEVAREQDAEPEVFHLEEDSFEEGHNGPKSAVSIQNLLIDNIDSYLVEEREPVDSLSDKCQVDCSTSWKNKSFDRLHLESDSVDTEYSKVCEVSGESVIWLASRLGPVLTSRYIARNLLRMLGLCFTGRDNLTVRRGVAGFATLVGDDNALYVVGCLTSITALYGEQVTIVQYIGHASDLISVCKRKLTSVLEGALIGSMSLISQTVGGLSDKALSEILPENLLRTLLHSALRLMASFSVALPSGSVGRRALAIKILACLIALTRRADHRQRLVLLQSIQRFFLAFNKVYDSGNDRVHDLPLDCELKNKGKIKDDICDSPPLSLGNFSDSDPSRLQAKDELKQALSPEFAYLSFKPFADFFGESVMEQTLKNYGLIKGLCDQYVRERCHSGNPMPGVCDIEAPHIVEELCETPQVGSFGSTFVIGNRIDFQEPASPAEDGCKIKRPTLKPSNRHLHGNWLAYWEHELGRSVKDTRMNVKQIKLQAFAGHCNSVKQIVTLASENSFMSASRDKTVRLWSLRSQGDGSLVSQPQWTYTGHRKSVLGLGWIERHRLTVSTDSSVHVWDPFVGRPVIALGPDLGRSGGSGAGSNCPAISIVRPIHPPSSCVACATTDGTVRTLDVRTRGFVNELKVSQNPGVVIRCLVASPESKWLAVGQASGILTVINLITGGIINSWKAHDAEILQIIAVDEQFLISSALDQTISVWNVHDGKLKLYLRGPAEPVHCLELSGTEVITGTTANRIGVHTSIDSPASFTSTRLRSDTFKGVLTSMAVLPLNRLLLLGADSGMISLIC